MEYVKLTKRTPEESALYLQDKILKNYISKKEIKKAIYKLAVHFSDRELADESVWLLKELRL